MANNNMEETNNAVEESPAVPAAPVVVQGTVVGMAPAAATVVGVTGDSACPPSYEPAGVMQYSGGALGVGQVGPDFITIGPIQIVRRILPRLIVMMLMPVFLLVFIAFQSTVATGGFGENDDESDRDGEDSEENSGIPMMRLFHVGFIILALTASAFQLYRYFRAGLIKIV